MADTTIAFIGAGNMASALVQGLIKKGSDPGHVLASDHNPDKLAELARRCGIQGSADNIDLARRADLLVLAVKPQGLKAVAEEVAPTLRERLAAGRPCLLLSVAAGITLDSLQRWVDAAQPIVRCMPNTPALVGAGASALFANAAAGEEQRKLAEEVMAAVGSVSWLASEAEMDAVTALSGSGPAYFFLMMEAMQDAGVKLGLDPETARRLSLQTAWGAASLARESEHDVAELRRRVTSPGGTTQAALKQFEEDGFRALVERAMRRAADRSRELARDSD